jgi:hypothetical protein
MSQHEKKDPKQDRKKAKPRKKKKTPRPPSAVQAAKAAARATLGTPRPAIRLENTKERKHPKHKRSLSDILAEGE